MSNSLGFAVTTEKLESTWLLVLTEIRARIASGEIQGGTKLRASHLSESMGVSRTPLREALVQLEAEGLLVRERSGYRVRSFSIAEVYAAIEVRGAIEGLAVRLGVEQGVVSDDLDAMRDLLEKLDVAVANTDISDYALLNSQFHEIQANLPRLTFVEEEVSRSYRFPFASPSAFLSSEDVNTVGFANLHEAQTQHRAIFDAISNGQATRAEALVLEHARIAQTNIKQALNKMEGAQMPPQLSLVS